MRFPCILAVLTAAALYARSAALPVVPNAITESDAIPDVAISLNGGRHLRRADEGDNTEERKQFKLIEFLINLFSRKKQKKEGTKRIQEYMAFATKYTNDLKTFKDEIK